MYRSVLCRLCGLLVALAVAACGGQPDFPDATATSRLATLESLTARAVDQLAALSVRPDAAGRASLLGTLRERAVLMTDAVRSEPARASAVALAPEVLGRLRAVVPEADVLLEAHATLEGALDVLIPEDPAGRELAPMVQLGGTSLHAAPDVLGGLRSALVARAEGVLAPDRGHFACRTVSAVELGDGNPGSRLPQGSQCGKLGPQRLAVILVKPPSTPDPMPAAEVQSVYFDQNLRSLDGYWREVSGGRASAAGDVFGWYELDKEYACSDLAGIFNKAVAIADADVDFLDYRGVVFVFPMPAGGCPYAGTSSVGCTLKSSPGDGAFVASLGYLVSDYLDVIHDGSVGLVAHEAGHNLGLGHAMGRDYGGEIWGAPASTGSVSEYADPFSVMGDATNLKLGHYNIQNKAYLGWVDPGDVQNVEVAGSYTLSPVEAPAGVRGLRVRRAPGSSEWLAIEYRQPLGSYDLLPPAVFDAVLLHAEDGNTLYNKTHLLDATPGSAVGLADFKDGALPLGATYSDVYTGLAVTAHRVGGDVVVDVTYGAPSCTIKPASLTVTPIVSKVAGSQVVPCQVTITSNDVGCPAQPFKLTPTLPAGWIASPSTVTVKVGPGQSVTTAINVTVPANVNPALSAVKFTQSRGSGASSFTTIAATQSASPGFTATLTVAPDPVVVGGQTTLLVKVRKNNAPLAATTQIGVVLPDGSVAWGSGATNGDIGYAYLPPRKGTYNLVANATSAGLTVTSNVASFTVN